ncbi:MAG: hypothetical protein JSV53_02230 [candidate division WOR-3 bacterium]|nr:MAG: hypothetical protein JSV53_02230 [candidate division WOR-3 bacterium]
MDRKDFSIDEALRFGWNTMKTNFWFFFGILVAMIAAIYIPYALAVVADRLSSGLAFLFYVVSYVIAMIVNIGLIRIVLKLVDGEKPDFADLFRFQGFFWRYLGGSLLMALIVSVGVMLFVIPGIIWAIVFQFYGWLIIDKNLGIMDALSHSLKITKTVRWKLLGFGVLLGLINYLGILVFVVGLFATIPTTMVAYAHVYRKLLVQTENSGTVRSKAND